MDLHTTRALIALPLVAVAFAGCAAPVPTCDEGVPLAIAAERDAQRPRIMIVETTFHNCTKESLTLSDPCGLTTGIVPSLGVDGETYYLQNATTIETTAVPNTHLLCDFDKTRTDKVAPGTILSRRSQWDGTVLTSSGSAAAQTGTFDIVAQAGPFRESVRIQVPWS